MKILSKTKLYTIIGSSVAAEYLYLVLSLLFMNLFDYLYLLYIMYLFINIYFICMFHKHRPYMPLPAYSEYFFQI